MGSRLRGSGRDRWAARERRHAGALWWHSRDHPASGAFRERTGLTRSAGLPPCDHDPATRTGSPGRAGSALGDVARCARPATRASGTCSAGAATAGAGCPRTIRRHRTTRCPGASRATRQTVPRSRSASAPEGRAESLRRNRLAAGVATSEESPAYAEPRQRRKRIAKRQRDRQRARAPRRRLCRRPAGRVAARVRSSAQSSSTVSQEAASSCGRARSSTDAVGASSALTRTTPMCEHVRPWARWVTSLAAASDGATSSGEARRSSQGWRCHPPYQRQHGLRHAAVPTPCPSRRHRRGRT